MPGISRRRTLPIPAHQLSGSRRRTIVRPSCSPVQVMPPGPRRTRQLRVGSWSSAMSEASSAASAGQSATSATSVFSLSDLGS